MNITKMGNKYQIDANLIVKILLKSRKKFEKKT